MRLIFPDRLVQPCWFLDNLAPVAQAVANRSGNKVRGISREFDTLVGIEVFESRQQAQKTFLYQVLERLARVEEPPRNRLDKRGMVVRQTRTQLRQRLTVAATPATCGVLVGVPLGRQSRRRTYSPSHRPTCSSPVRTPLEVPKDAGRAGATALGRGVADEDVNGKSACRIAITLILSFHQCSYEALSGRFARISTAAPAKSVPNRILIIFTGLTRGEMSEENRLGSAGERQPSKAARPLPTIRR